MKALGPLVSLVVMLALQTTLGHAITGNRTVVDLVLVLVIYVALTRGVAAGLLFGSLAGLCQDALSGGVVGVGGLAKSLVGAGVGAMATQFIITNSLPRLMAFILGTVLHSLLFLGVYELIRPGSFGTPWASIATQAAITAVTGLLFFAAVERLPGMWRRRRMRRTHLRSRMEA